MGISSQNVPFLCFLNFFQQNKQVKKLHMPIKHEHKSLASTNEIILFYINFSSIITQTKKWEYPFSISSFFNASMYFNYDFDFIFFDCELVKWYIREVRQAWKSTTGTLSRSLDITMWSVSTLPPRNIQL